jgi:dihydroxyacetone kinase
LLATSGGSLSWLDGYPHIKVVYRSDWDKSKVALISGGGSGHEPAYAGFVGAGMLTAAVCGEVFASPSVEAVLAGILAVTGEAGCLLIVKNYTGDRLNYGLAVERAEKSASIGMSLDTCTVPGSHKEDRIAPGNAELGLGIHGEAGVEQVKFENAKTAMQMVLEKLEPHMSQGPAVALLNNLGSTTPLEMSVLANELMSSPLAEMCSL